MTKYLKPIIVLVLLVVVSYPASVYAWENDDHSSAICDGEWAKVRVTFKNLESKAMNVVAFDENTGKSVDLGQINPGETKVGIIDLGIHNTEAGRIRFEMTWSSGEEGSDIEYSRHSDEICKKDEEEEDEEEDHEDENGGEEENGGEDENGNGDEEGENGGGVGGKEEEKISEDKKSENLEVNKKVRIGDNDKYSSKVVGVDQSEIITFLLELKNTGEKNIQDIKVVDDLPEEFELISGKLEDKVGEVKDGEAKNLFIVVKVKDGVNLAGKCVINKVEAKWDDNKESDEATVCFEEKELIELPKTGPDGNLLSVLGALSLIMGTTIKVYTEIKKG
ncbi:hypothetical protein A3F07_01940 [candidate division WWE3 bacterium RIFCSPHIGHO2_12_FULL_38_15]|uniref:DUF11 domain-containing protein n=1 Tax=candidate division WWE3 bacterium RIFCSPHIGHO2_02_FULL_38_14 TaxID=1802620 RepID=A0A1F4V859_UNCKA|nr:MAG: hypothetical protein A2793_03175 [candidate division WWE3 bacterium RIFCSPHIGHO2_01_FULL_38_45]OGC48642.1 MAG: hypothetical protein A3F07_01940 [candidate division WWE3 bacterium RIFCSPHIGHO2_12_FULL_38_15]OGC53048.1 MAG: hypothetical protein A3B64_01200 [candidate division WWE3 bacterium RIFCSPLOWO2_01_FULL_37_24]OGC53411.1 MAG: hypothetical protein A3D91_00055 [candidate division WWE3 bacterium RIFCSPHIGHO2_02_FULL_38_14]HLB51885.1 hypothetical protein [Patescibacteria group bacterium